MSTSPPAKELEAWYQEALRHQAEGKLEIAKERLERLRTHLPKHPVILSTLGNLEYLQGHFSESVSLYQASVKEVPSQPETLNNLGAALKKLQKAQEAINAFENALRLRPDYSDPHCNLGHLYLERGQTDQAKTHLLRALDLAPQSTEALINWGLFCQSQHAELEAINAYEKAIRLNPRAYIAWSNLSKIYRDQGDNQAALAACNQAINLAPDSFEAWNNRGSVHQAMMSWDQALEDHKKALEINPNCESAHFNLGVVQQRTGRPTEAIAHYRAALRLNPQHADAHLNLSHCLLSTLNLEEGWDHYEWRWLSSGMTEEKINPELPVWQGDIGPESLLVLGEQGVGDQILYSSMLKFLKERIKNLTLTVDERLIPILARSYPSVQFLPMGSRINPALYDRVIHLASLCQHVLKKLSDFSRVNSPYLKADSLKCSERRDFLSHHPRPWIGISWKSRNQKIGPQKSLDPRAIWPLVERQGGCLVNLQYGDTKEERAAFLKSTGHPILQDERLDLFADLDGLTSLIDVCDLIVTTSNVTAHLAGALGKETQLLLPNAEIDQHWYWHSHDSRSLWYPSVHRVSLSPLQDHNVEDSSPPSC